MIHNQHSAKNSTWDFKGTLLFGLSVLLYNKCFNRVVMKYEKKKQKLITLIRLELLGESNFHF